MKRTGRLVAAAGALLVLVGGAGPAEAAAKARAQNVAPQKVSTAYWAIVVQGEKEPALEPGAALAYNGVGPFYGVMTNIGTVKPGSLELVSGGLTVVKVLEACTTQWTPRGECPATSTKISMDLTGAITDQAKMPGPGVTWWLKFNTVLALGGTLSAIAKAPTGSIKDT